MHKIIGLLKFHTHKLHHPHHHQHNHHPHHHHHYHHHHYHHHFRYPVLVAGEVGLSNQTVMRWKNVIIKIITVKNYHHGHHCKKQNHHDCQYPYDNNHHLDFHLENNHHPEFYLENNHHLNDNHHLDFYLDDNFIFITITILMTLTCYWRTGASTP